MESIGLVASVIAVAQLTGACLKLSRKWLGPSEFTTTELRSITADLYAFNGILRTFQTHIEICEEDEARLVSLQHLEPVLDSCNEALGAIKAFSEKTGYIGKHMIAPRFDRKVKLSLEVLRRAKDVFVLAVQADHQYAP